MKNIELTELEQRTLSCIVNNPSILMSALTRKMHSMGLVNQDDRQLIIDVLQSDYHFITLKTEPFELGKRGRRAQVFSATNAGKKKIKEIISDNKKTS